jgi:hypothetical protein
MSRNAAESFMVNFQNDGRDERSRGPTPTVEVRVAA